MPVESLVDILPCPPATRRRKREYCPRGYPVRVRLNTTEGRLHLDQERTLICRTPAAWRALRDAIRMIDQVALDLIEQDHSSK